MQEDVGFAQLVHKFIYFFHSARLSLGWLRLSLSDFDWLNSCQVGAVHGSRYYVGTRAELLFGLA